MSRFGEWFGDPFPFYERMECFGICFFRGVFFFCWGGGRGFGRLHSKALCLRILLGLFFRMASCLVLKYVFHRENGGTLGMVS